MQTNKFTKPRLREDGGEDACPPGSASRPSHVDAAKELGVTNIITRVVTPSR